MEKRTFAIEFLEDKIYTVKDNKSQSTFEAICNIVKLCGNG